ncbi:NAD(P)-dependent oxidoreductase [Streptomyces sp. NBC_00448]|uniref:NAD(P)-dependent oxidoreductase n=1 Tax=Streptomyces sp. NBC_00448 TaxID=2903652 RepID=UPI002E24F51F
MRLAIFAATGGIGTQLLAQALAGGHSVTAVVRNPAKLGDHAGRDDAAGRDVHVVTADLSAPDPEVLARAVKGADAVLSGFGPRGRADAGHTGSGTRAIVEAMRTSGVRRIVAVSAAPVSTTPSPGRPHPPRHDPGDGTFMRYVAAPLGQFFLGKVFADVAVMEDVLRDSGLDWTVVRPPRLTDKPFTGSYRTAADRNLKGGFSVPRADVAHLMLSCLTDPATVHHALGVAT